MKKLLPFLAVPVLIVITGAVVQRPDPIAQWVSQCAAREAQPEAMFATHAEYAQAFHNTRQECQRFADANR